MSEGGAGYRLRWPFRMMTGLRSKIVYKTITWWWMGRWLEDRAGRTTDMTWDAQIYAMEENGARPGPYPVQGQRVLETGRRLIRMGHEVTIFTPYPCWGEDSEDVRELKVIHLTPVLPWLSHPQEVPLTPSLRHHIGRERLDIVHSRVATIPPAFSPGRHWAEGDRGSTSGRSSMASREAHGDGCSICST